MRFLATTEQMKELDRAAIEERGVPSLELMERAARAVAGAAAGLAGAGRGKPGASAVGLVLSRRPDGPPAPEEEREMEELRAVVESKNTDPAARIAVFCGPGNNGGDGIAAARLLREAGYRARCFLVGERHRMTPDAKAMEGKLLAAGGTLEPLDLEDRGLTAWLATCDCCVDALFGVGLRRPLEGDFLAAVEWMNRMARPVVACDLPSGLDGDTGQVLGRAVRAAVTVTFTCPKTGLYLGEGRAYAGRVETADIGIPSDLVRALTRGEEPGVWAMEGGRYVLPRRPRTAHKGDFGKVFILAGSEGYTGAPVLAARGAVRTGAGLVYLGVPRDIYPIVAVKCDEAMPFPLPREYGQLLEKARGCDAALIGPGLGRGREAEALALSLLADLEIPVVLDADGINALSGHIDILEKRRAPTVLTPHDGEFRRLTGCEVPIRDRLAAARDFARAHRCTLVLKGHATVTAAPDGRAWVNATGNPGMAKGGAGDVLAGMLASLWGQRHLNGPGTDRSELAAVGVYCHGLAGDLCARALGEYAMTPGDLVQALPEVLKEQEERVR